MQTLLLTLTRSVADVDNNYTSIDDDGPYLATAHRQHHHQHQCPAPTITRKTPTTKTTSPALSIGEDGEPCGGLSLALAWTMTVSTPTLSLLMDASDGSTSPDDVTTAIRPQPPSDAAHRSARNMATLREIELQLKPVRNIEKIPKV